MFRFIAGPGIPIVTFREGDDFVVELNLPGVESDSNDLGVERNVLTARAERRTGASSDSDVLIAERLIGSFSRRLYLGETLDTDCIAAGYEAGMLRLTIASAERSKPRKIEIRVGNSSPKKINA
ncbi:Hsp20/alpha crystallin family protein [Streptomyces sp. NPDC001966]